jgi:hypothetical protein
MGLTKMIERVLVGILGSMDATAHNAKHDKRKNMKSGQREEWIGLVLWINYSLDQSNGMKCYRIMKIIPQAFHRVQDHQNRNPEWKVMPKLRCAENRMIRRSHFCEHQMNCREEENKSISTGWSGGTIGWLRRFILCFFRKHTERYSRRNG